LHSITIVNLFGKKIFAGKYEKFGTSCWVMDVLTAVGVIMKQLYTDENHKLVNGNLEITALKQGDKYTSRLTTKDKKNFSTVILKLEQSCLLGKEFGLHSDAWV
jgi:hypothetical protein